jgi:hypothetical protein
VINVPLTAAGSMLFLHRTSKEAAKWRLYQLC